jgi:hypothetical protein
MKSFSADAGKGSTRLFITEGSRLLCMLCVGTTDTGGGAFVACANAATAA